MGWKFYSDLHLPTRSLVIQPLIQTENFPVSDPVRSLVIQSQSDQTSFQSLIQSENFSVSIQSEVLVLNIVDVKSVSTKLKNVTGPFT